MIHVCSWIGANFGMLKLINQKLQLLFSRHFSYPNRNTLNNITLLWTIASKTTGYSWNKFYPLKHILRKRGNLVGSSKSLDTLHKNFALSTCNKTLIIKYCIIFIMTYTSPNWGSIGKNFMEILSKIHNENLRTI